MILNIPYENIKILHSTIINHEDFNVESISKCSLSGHLKRLSLSPDFEISKFMGLTKKNMNRYHQQKKFERTKHRIQK